MIVLKTNYGYLSGYKVNGRLHGVEAEYSDESTSALFFTDRAAATDFVIKNGWRIDLFRVEPADFDAMLGQFVKKAEMLIRENERKLYENVKFNSRLEVMHGRRYVRVVKTDDFDHRSAYCFVDKQNGNVLKADGWKRPARHARGNIYGEDGGLGGVTPYGATYIRY